MHPYAQMFPKYIPFYNAVVQRRTLDMKDLCVNDHCGIHLLSIFGQVT